MKIYAKVEYLGTSYYGWQKQINELSIQEVIEGVLSKILNTDISIYGSGRTDRGVHALGQTFHFEVNKEVDLARLRYSVNMLLPSDIHILEFKEVSDDFHARFSSTGKTYLYQIYLGEKDPFLNNRMLNYPYPFDEELFKKALNLFIGEHDFKDFTSKEEDESNFVRRIDNISVSKKDKIINIEITGNGFMRYMIRFIIGASLAVSSSKEDLSFISNHLDQEKRDIISYKVDASGLYLKEVYY